MAVTAPCGASFCATSLPNRASTSAVGDVDGDGRPDLLIGEVGPLVGALGPLKLLRNVGGAFVDITAWSGLAGYGAWSAAFGDLDGDGDQDLVLGGRASAPADASERGEELVFVNDGTGRFARRALGLAPTVGFPMGMILADLDGDGILDVVSTRAGTNRDARYVPRVLLGRPGATFIDGSSVVDDDGFGWLALATDLDGDGGTDLLLPHDSFGVIEVPPRASPEQSCEPSTRFVPASWINAAYRNTGVPGAPGFTLADLGSGYANGDLVPMGVAVGDFDRDGRFDYLFTTVGNPVLLQGRAGGLPVVAALPAGMDRPMPSSTKPSAWSALARDIDSDGLVDVLMTWGVIPFGPRTYDNTIFLGRETGGFEVMAPGSGFDLPGRSWASLATADFDGDGDDDLVVGAQTIYLGVCERPAASGVLLLNQHPREGRHWLRLRLRGTVANPDGLGARVEATTARGVVLREVSRAGGTMAWSDADVHLGLGDATRITALTVRWPDGYVQTLTDVAADRAMTVTEPRWLSAPAAGRADQAVTVSVTPPPGDDVSLGFHGDARWLGEGARRADGGFDREFTGRGDVAVVATSRGGLRGVRRIRFAP